MTEVFTEGSATARVVADSIHKGSRLVSIETEFPRPFLAEFNTHCRFSRNSASSRAIPVWKRMLSVLDRPYVPNSFGTNRPGMQAGETLSLDDQESVTRNWLVGRDVALIQSYFLTGRRRGIVPSIKGEKDIAAAEALCDHIEELERTYHLGDRLFPQDKGLHKQHANRVLEPYSFHTVIVTATHWRNFFGLRASALAQPEAQDFALAMVQAMMASQPKKLQLDDWLPYIREEDFAEASTQLILAYASAGKCARTSYLTQDGRRDIKEDVILATVKLAPNGHMSPLQHPARPRETRDPAGSNGNYSPVWTQLRKLFENENDFSKLIKYEDLVIGCRGDEAMAEFILSLPE